jgi:hypothetical protein
MWVLMNQKVNGATKVLNWVNTDLIERVHPDPSTGELYVHFQSGEMFLYEEDLAWWSQNVVGVKAPE